MYLGQGYFLLSVWAVAAAYENLAYNLVEAPAHLELYKTGFDRLNANSVGRLNVIPVVPRPSAFQRPSGFRRPTTTRRPFRKRPMTAAAQPTTPSPQPLPEVRPPTRPPQILPAVSPQTPSPQVEATTPRPLPATAPPPAPLPSTVESPLPQETPSPQLPVVVPEIPPSIPTLSQQPIVVLPEVPSLGIPFTQPEDVSQPLVLTPFQPQSQPTVPDFASQPPFVAAQIPDTGVSQLPVFEATNVPQRPPSFEEPPPFQRPPAAPSQSQFEAQPPFEGPNVPPNIPTSPTFASSQTYTGGGGGRPQEPLVFPVGRPPLIVSSRPPAPFRPRPPSPKPPSTKPPSAQPPFDSGPHVPPKPPPVPVTSTTSFGVNQAPPDQKPQRPLPPSRPILLNPLPLPKPPFQLTTTEKPSVIFNESTMSDDGNYTFDFLVTNSVYRKEQGFLKKSLVYPGHLIHVKTGAYSFTSPEGTFHRIDFVADENGYRAFESSN